MRLAEVLWKERTPWLVSWTIMGLVTWLIFPYYQYYIDPDATAYLTIARRYAEGDWGRAINGYWSPWACWGTAAGIRLGGAPFASAITFNFLGASLFLALSLNLARRFSLPRSWIFAMGITLALFLVYAQFKQSFDDIWAFAFLLVALRILISESYSRHLVWALILGGVGALAYLAKAYAFPFFVFQLLCFHYFFDRERANLGFRRWRTALVLGALLLFSFPWIYLLWQQYGFWSLGTAGPLNRAWFLLGSPIWKDPQAVFLPPPYSDSPYYWEDPFWVNGALPSFWESPRLLVKQVFRTGWNLLLFFQSSAALSIFFLPAWLMSLGLSGSWTRRLGLPEEWRKLSGSLALFPLAYFLVNFEPRYLWYMVPLTMILGGWVLGRRGLSWLNTWERRGLVLVFWFSYLAYPLWDMYRLFEVGKEDFEIAQVLKRKGIEGPFTHWEPRENVPSLARIAYFSGNPMYLIQPPSPGWERVDQAMKQEDIEYFYYFGEDLPWKWTEEEEGSFTEILQGAVPGFQVWKRQRVPEGFPSPDLGN